LREYVIAAGAVVAQHDVSQFATQLGPIDVVGADAVKVDSDDVAALVKQYAKTNNVDVTFVNYELTKDPTHGIPVWQVACYDAHGKQVASMVIGAIKETVIAHDGFPKEPMKTQARTAQAPVERGGTEKRGTATPEVVAAGPDVRFPSSRNVPVRRSAPIASPAPSPQPLATPARRPFRLFPF
jgi:hypothetical protein